MPKVSRTALNPTVPGRPVGRPGRTTRRTSIVDLENADIEINNTDEIKIIEAPKPKGNAIEAPTPKGSENSPIVIETSSARANPPRMVLRSAQNAEAQAQRQRAAITKTITHGPTVVPNNGRRIAQISALRPSQLRNTTSINPTTAPTKNGVISPNPPGSSDSTISAPNSHEGTPSTTPISECWMGHRTSPTVQKFTHDEWEAAMGLVLLHQHVTYADQNKIPQEVLRSSYVTRFGSSDDILSQTAQEAISAIPAAFNAEDLRWLVWAVERMGNKVTARNFHILATDFNGRFPYKKMTPEQLYYKWAAWHEEMSRASRAEVI